MPQRSSSRGMYTRLVLFTLAGFALWALGRNRPDSHAGTTETARVPDTTEPFASEVTRTRARERSSFSKRRLATSLTFATLFFAGAALSAGAGDMVAEMVEEGAPAAETTPAEAPAEEAPPAEAPSEPEAPAEEPAEAPAEQPADQPAQDAPADEPAEGPAEEPANDGGSGDGSGGSDSPADGGGEGGQPGNNGGDNGAGEGDNGSEEGEQPAEEEEPAPEPKDDEPSGDAEPEADEEADHSEELPAEPPAETSAQLEVESGGFATVWLHRVLPDPTPPAKRLTWDFARRLSRTAKANELEWEFMLAVLRASGHRNAEPATQTGLNRLARELVARHASDDPWKAALAMAGRTAFADRTMALTYYHQAVGLRALVTGLEAAKPALEDAVLFDPRIDMYAGGVSDVQSGRIDVRVLVLLRYLAERHGQVTVSSLKTGHGFFARPGVPSAHMYGLAVDISALEGRSILGNQAPGGLTERAVRNILLLPVELRPRQVISLLGLGGPSFPLEDHHDHIHVGY